MKLLDPFDKPFFYTWFMCFRSRMYPSNRLTNPHGPCFAQFFLELSTKESSEDLCFDIMSDNSYAKVQIEKWHKDAIKEASKSFFHIKLKYVFKQTYARLDISASGLQIFCGLIGCLLGLILSNLVRLKNTSTPEKLDFYGDFITEFLLEYDTYLKKKLSKRYRLFVFCRV